MVKGVGVGPIVGIGEGKWRVLARRKWKAYPTFAPPEQFASFVPVHDEFVYYVNAIETGVSVCIYIDTYKIYTCIYMCVRAYLYIHIYISIHISIYVYINIYIYIHIYIY